VVANGEIWSVADARRCRALSGCHALMLGRGMVRDPGLALAVREWHANAPEGDALRITWPTLLPLVADFWHLVCNRLDRRKHCGRLKQWLNFLRQRYPEAGAAYLELRTLNDPLLIGRWLEQQQALYPPAASTAAAGKAKAMGVTAPA
jgi:tRNA-dihydrouridine synthase C